ncbi:MAG: hypothetical protein IPF73_13855 [Betaproteobacteria bacterium]|nr:hypothetical protein [Betaproteobacteria bacterium]
MNCFVMGTLDDSLDGIFRALHEAAITLQQGGGVGTDFSPLRPKGARTDATGGRSSGPVSFMQLWEQMCATVTDASPRRGAMMGVLACDHPDIHAFVAAKRVAGRLTHFNVSVLVQDAFMRAVAGDGPWTLAFPRFGIERETRRATCGRGRRQRLCVGGTRRAVHRPHPRRGQPRVLRDDQRDQPLRRDPAAAVRRVRPGLDQPGRVRPRSVHGTRAARRRGAIAALVPARGADARQRLDGDAPSGARARRAGRSSRRIGLGITGLGDALAMLGLRYDSDAGRATAAGAMREIVERAYASSIELARERGAFPRFRARAVPRRAVRRAAAPGAAGRHREARAAQQPPRRDRAGRHHQRAGGGVSSGIEPILRSKDAPRQAGRTGRSPR